MRGLTVRPTQVPLAEMCVNQETEALSARETGIPCLPCKNNSVHHLKTRFDVIFKKRKTPLHSMNELPLTDQRAAFWTVFHVAGPDPDPPPASLTGGPPGLFTLRLQMLQMPAKDFLQ